MSAAGVRPRASRILGHAIGIGLACACVAAPPAQAAIFEPCGTIKESEIAAAFGLSDVVKHNTIVAAPGNPTGVVRSRCSAFAWRGPKPTNKRRKRESLLAGTLARLEIQSWQPDETPQADAWRASFAATLKRIRERASGLFLRELDGVRLLPPRFEAESAIAFSAAPGQTHRVRALWWSHDLKSLLVIDAVEAKGQPTVAALKAIASIVVTEFFRRP